MSDPTEITAYRLVCHCNHEVIEATPEICRYALDLHERVVHQ